jgi:O-antigen/teichoic acid export membrane protein
LIAVAGWVTVIYFTHAVYFQNPQFLIASFIYLLGVLLTSYFTSLFYAKKEFGLPNKILFIVNIALVIFLIVGKGNTTVRAYFLEIYFVGFFLQGVLLSGFFYRRYGHGGKRIFPERSMLKIVVRYSLFALVANLIYFLVNRIDYWFVEHYCPKKDLGNYIQASKLAQMLLILPAILGSTLFPLFSSQEKSGSRSQLTAVVRVLFGINLAVCFLILATGWYFIPLIFGSSYHLMYFLFLFLIPGILCTSMNYPVTAWFSAADRIAINLRGALLALVIICTGDLFILPHAGIMAAPVISSAGYFSYYCYTVYIYRKENPVSWKEFLFLRKSDVARIYQSILSKDLEFPAESSAVQNSTT